MPTYRILTKAGQKGPFTLRVILRGLETGKIPKTATLEEVETGRHLTAGELGSSQVIGPGSVPSPDALEAPQPLELAEGNLDPVPHYPVGHTLPYQNQLATPTPHTKAGAGKLIAVAAVAGACVGSLVIGLVLFILLRDDGSQPTERVATPRAEGVANQPREQNESATEASPPNNEVVVAGNEEPSAEPAPFTIAELRSYFAEDKEAARRLMGEVVLIEGYLFDPWHKIRHLYKNDGRELMDWNKLYLCSSPGADDTWLVDHPSQWISLEVSVFHDKWSLIDRNRLVVIAGRLTTERSLDKVDWKFAD